MGLDIRYIDVKQFAQSDIESRKEFISTLKESLDSIPEFGTHELLELATTTMKFFSDRKVFQYILFGCNESCLQSTEFLNTLFFICDPKAKDIMDILKDECYVERFVKDNTHVRTLFDKYCTYNMIPHEVINIDEDTLVDGCRGSNKWPYQFLTAMSEPLGRNILNKQSARIFAYYLHESISISSNSFEKKLSDVLMIHETTLKNMCRVSLFKEFLSSSLGYIQKYVSDYSELPFGLDEKMDKLSTIVNYSKLIK